MVNVFLMMKSVWVRVQAGLSQPGLPTYENKDYLGDAGSGVLEEFICHSLALDDTYCGFLIATYMPYEMASIVNRSPSVR